MSPAEAMNDEQEYRNAVAGLADRWVPACGGLEVPFTYNGTRWLYVFNPRRHEHGHLNLDTDIVHDMLPRPC